MNPFYLIGRDKRIENFFDMYDSILLASTRARLRTMLFNAFMISGSLLLFGLLAFSGSRDWGTMVTYLTGLVILGSGINQIGGVVAALNRFYPQVAEYIQFITQVEI